ncbi:MAG: hypothetical protein PHH00_01130 [Candidatus Nanoarchaeia archaeon]|nr:hypothetical protein [Candidatus Nanoarchaeia archaeon]
MTEKSVEDLKEYFRNIYPPLWEHYKFLYERRTEIQKKFEFLIAFESLLTLIFISLFRDLILDGSVLFVVSLLFLLTPIFVSYFLNLVPARLWFPWFEKENLRETWNSRRDKDFSEEGLRSIYGVLGHLWSYYQNKKKLFLQNVLFWYTSIIISLSLVIIYFEGAILLLPIILVSILCWLLIYMRWDKELVKKSPALESEEFFNKWKKEELEKK